MKLRAVCTQDRIEALRELTEHSMCFEVSLCCLLSQVISVSLHEFGDCRGEKCQVLRPVSHAEKL